ncbi:MAG TPA: hypothetical protein VEY09_16005 [Pyrinomonadaceae bacterium]|nr:hypothetical protein [Pyrinomonadaceae bacterium]
MRQVLFALALAGLLAAPGAAARAQGGAAVTGDWAAVRALAPGAKLVVRMMDGDRLKGVFEHATDEALVITRKGRQQALDRRLVRRVQLDRGKSRAKGALFGAAVGAGAGFGVGGAVYFPHRDDFVDTTVPSATALGAAIGAGIGAALGKGNKNVTIFEQ